MARRFAVRFLSWDEEEALLRRARDPATAPEEADRLRNRVIEARIPLAVQCAVHRRPIHMELDESVGEALLTLVRAARTADPALGPFSTHARWKIRGRFSDLRKAAQRSTRHRAQYEAEQEAQGPPTVPPPALPSELPPLATLLLLLTPDERLVLAAYYGLDQQTPQSMAAIGLQTGHDRDWARRQHRRALATLRAALAAVEPF